MKSEEQLWRDHDMYILISLCLCIAALFIYVERLGKYIPAVVLKAAASLCFVILGFLNTKGDHISNLIIGGLILGAVADVLLNLRYVFKEKGKLAFLAGILVFLAGHIVYLAAVFRMNPHWLICVMSAVILTIFLMQWLFTMITAERTFKIFGIVYIGAIVLLNCTALVNLLYAPSPFTRIFFAGSFLFLISDIILILNTFGPKAKFPFRIANLMLYYIGQILIALSMMFL